MISLYKLIHSLVDRFPVTVVVITLFIGHSVSLAEPLQFSAGGFFKLNVLSGGISAGGNLNGDSELWVPDIPVDDGADADFSHLNSHARESRLWLRAVQDTPLGRLEALVEGDLDADRIDNSHDPRLRHAYIVLGRLLVGQTYTTFTNTSALADLNSGIAVGNVVTRHRLLRWQQPLTATASISVALEEPLNRLHFAGEAAITSTGDRRPPDLVVKIDRTGNRGNISLSALVREISTTGPTAPSLQTDSAIGTAVSLAGRIATGSLDNLRFMFNHGNALARYSTLSTYADATVTPAGEIELATLSSAMIAWQHFWEPRWRSTFAFSYSRADPHGTSSRKLTRDSRSAHANLIWTPGRRLSVGIEFLYGWRSLLNGADGELQRLQLTTRINF